MDKWNEWHQYYKGPEKGIGNTLLKGTCATVKGYSVCYLKVDLDCFNVCTTNSWATTKNKKFKKSIFDVLREERNWNYIKYSVKTFREGRKRVEYDKKQEQWIEKLHIW